MLDQNKITESVKAIIRAKEHILRCALTGAPIGQIMESEIRLFVMNVLTSKPSMGVDTIVDNFAMSMITRNQYAAPAMAGTQQALANILELGLPKADAYARILTAYLTRFFYSQKIQGSLVDAALSRMRFSADWFDYLLGYGQTEQGLRKVEKLLNEFALADTWLHLGKWKELTLFGVNAKKTGIYSTSKKTLRSWMLAPEAMPLELESLVYAQKELLLLAVSATAIQAGPESIAPMNKDSQAIVKSLIEFAPVIGQQSDLAMFMSTFFEFDSTIKPTNDSIAIAQAETEMQKRIDSEPRNAMQAWSATHGKGVIPGGQALRGSRAATPAKPKKESTISKMASAISIKFDF